MLRSVVIAGLLGVLIYFGLQLAVRPDGHALPLGGTQLIVYSLNNARSFNF